MYDIDQLCSKIKDAEQRTQCIVYVEIFANGEGLVSFVRNIEEQKHFKTFPDCLTLLKTHSPF